ncbi:MAG TPA: FAD-dependent oxidoreductase, partial [Thermoanaerobaculia bacterium]
MRITHKACKRAEAAEDRYDRHHHYRHEAPTAVPESRGNPLVEEGTAFLSLTEAEEISAFACADDAPRERETSETVPAPRVAEHFDVLVIGAGQSGLSVGYHLAQSGLRFAILDANERVGDTWRRRWDSLRLFTAARWDGLVGMPFPAPRFSFPTKDEMADYLGSYAKRFALPVIPGIRVERLRREGGLYVAEARSRVFTASQVIVAMATYQKGRIPQFAAELDSGILQLHSSDYRNPSQLRPGPVLLVGAANSGAEIALDIARRSGRGDPDFAPVYLAGRDTGHVPFRINGLFARRFIAPLVLRVIFHRILTRDTPIGRALRPKMVSRGSPLIRVRPEELRAAGIRRVARVAGVREGRPLLDDGRVLDVSNVIWATGFHPGFEWIELPIAKDAHGDPVQTRGVVESEPGLYFVGLHFLYAFSSTMIHGIARDAKHVADAVVRRGNASRDARPTRTNV